MRRRANLVTELHNSRRKWRWNAPKRVVKWPLKVESVKTDQTCVLVVGHGAGSWKSSVSLHAVKREGVCTTVGKSKGGGYVEFAKPIVVENGGRGCQSV